MKWSSLIVIAASAGGVDALRSLVAGLPADLAAPVLIVLHIGAHPSELPALLSAAGALPAKHAEHNERMRPGRIYVAPPDRHMIVVEDRLQLTRRPRENWARPAINPLFCSAADAWGPAVIGVILTGRLNDGTGGLIEINRRGGLTVVQTPDDAAYPEMPASALTHASPDYSLPLADIPALLVQLVAARQVAAAAIPKVQQEDRAMTSDQKYDCPVAVTCPDCGGALRREEDGSLIEYRCHIQHVYTAEVLAEAQFDQMERVMRAAERIVHERAELCRQMAVRADAAGVLEDESLWRTASRQAMDRAYEIRDLVEQDWIRPEATIRSVPLVAAG